VVALKILAGRLMEQAGIRGRFEAEAQAISSLNHPNICTLYDIGRHEDVDYLVMEYLDTGKP
jgi:serine/threonine protein kinase